MKRLLGGTLAAIILALSLSATGQSQSNNEFHVNVTMPNATTVPQAIPASSACRISNANGYNGSISVAFKPSTAATPGPALNLWLDNGGYVANFTPSSAGGSWLVFPKTAGTLIFTGTGGSGSSVLPLDCTRTPAAHPGFTPSPVITDVNGYYAVDVQGSPTVIVGNASVPQTPQPYPGVSPTPKIGVWVDCVYSSPPPSPNPTPSTGAELTPPCDRVGAPYTHLIVLDPCRDPTITESHAFLNMTTATTSTIITNSGNGLGTYICHIQVTSAAVDTMSVGYSTGPSNGAANCASGVTTLSQTYQLTLGFIDSYNGTWYSQGAYSVNPNDNTCITNGQNVNLGVDIWYIFHA